MRLASSVLTFILVVLFSLVTFAQEPSVSVPRLINITGVFRPADGQPPAAVETVTLAIYADELGGAPLWQETQPVAIDDRGRYSLLLGATVSSGIPIEIFGSGDAHWLGTRFERAGEVEGARVRLTSVPYALRAAEADTLGGRPASDYQLATTATGDADAKSATAATRSDVAGPTGTANFLPKYVDSVNFGDSVLYEAGGQIGLGTTTPFDIFHVRYTNTGGNLTGFAVQNMGNSATSYSGMLFYDQNNQLGQFQGFNNSTHEYRINNVARVTPGGAFNGSINFMLGGASKFIVAPNGNIGIGTTGPSALLEVSNAIPGGPANMWMTSYTNAINPYYMARRARGTVATPTAVQNGDALAGFYGEGYGATAFGSGFAGGMTVQAIQNWTDTAHGTALAFSVTPFNATAPATRMTLDAGGNFGIGTSLPTALLEISNGLTPGAPASATIATYNAAPGGSFLTGRKARGTPAAPTAVQNGDGLLSLSGRGYGTTGFGFNGGATIGMRATENYTDTAMGSLIQFFTTPNGTTTLTPRMTIDQNGFVGIGTPTPNGMLDIHRNGTTNVYGTSYGTQGSGFKGRVARGTFAAPTATQSGDELAEFTAAGHDGTDFLEGAGWAAFAAENWTNTAHGTVMGFFATPLGGSDAQLYMAINPNGNVGINPQLDVNGFPLVDDKLQVYGDIRVGTTGTNGCIKNFAGTGIIGTCSSDRRLKKNITPFAPMLDKVTALQPVHYVWRADEFPDRHFGNARNYGLIAQDVEQVLPELVATDNDGYKAIDYSKLPLLTIQAVKELKAENDELKQEVAELKRLMNELLASTRR
jgi:endosialidase-like protein